MHELILHMINKRHECKKKAPSLGFSFLLKLLCDDLLSVKIWLKNQKFSKFVQQHIDVKISKELVNVRWLID